MKLNIIKVMIILDFETNTSNIYDVIEVAAVKVVLEENSYKVLDKFHRYYLSKYPVNLHSYAVHKLSPQKILAHRKEASYSLYFQEDKEFVEFCKSAKVLIAHNINFELRHLGELIKFEKHFCTMKENKHLVKAVDKNGRIKNPTLDETCLFYNIDFDKTLYHSATYDVSKTYEILKYMDKNIFL